MKSGWFGLLFLAVALTVASGVEWHVVPGLKGRALATMVVDHVGRRAVMFGGGQVVQFNDVWQLTRDAVAGYCWSAVPTRGAPPGGRHGHAAIYDPVGRRMVIFGGRVYGTPGNDLWSLDLRTHTWEQLSPSGVIPGPRVYISAVYHPQRRSMIVFDGTSVSAPYDDVWELMLDSLKWRQLAPSGSRPSPRWSYALEFDADSNRMVVFGGEDGNGRFLNDVWVLGLEPGSERWARLDVSGSVPPARSTMTRCYDPVGRKLFIFGGYTYPPFVFYNDLHVLDLAELFWTRLQPSGSAPAERRGAAGVYDPFGRNFVVFGGQVSEGWESDVYYVDVASVAVGEWQTPALGRADVSLDVPAVCSRPVRIRYSLAESANVRIRIVDATGRVVATLHSGRGEIGGCAVVWDGRYEGGSVAPPGSYYCHLQTETEQASSRFVLVE